MVCGHRFVLLAPPAERTLYALASHDLFIVVVFVIVFVVGIFC